MIKFTNNFQISKQQDGILIEYVSPKFACKTLNKSPFQMYAKKTTVLHVFKVWELISINKDTLTILTALPVQKGRSDRSVK